MKQAVDQKAALDLPPRRRTPFAGLTEYAKAHARRFVKASQVRAISVSPGLHRARHVVIVVVHNEAARMPAFLAHHRKLGFEHFIVVDNRSDDDLRSEMAAMEDVTLFSAEGAFRRARFGNDWVNGILSRYCRNKWVLYVDADEHFVFPHSDTVSVAHLTAFLEANGRASLPCLMIDLYSDRSVAENVCRVGQNPIEVCDLYDRHGYVERIDPQTSIRWIKGGVRGRLFFENNLWQGPALNKTPLVHWQSSFAFLKSSHELYPPRANQRCDEAFPIRGALLHFKFLSTLPALLSQEVRRRQHTTEYDAYARLRTETQEGATHFVGPQTARYQDWRSLADDGLILGAGWPDRGLFGSERPLQAMDAC